MIPGKNHLNRAKNRVILGTNYVILCKKRVIQSKDHVNRGKNNGFLSKNSCDSR